jgi:NADH:ubiquinone oxidoreductase subunit F (NADH-binding)
VDILDKIKKAGLIGRGGGCFPVADKWLMVREAPSASSGQAKGNKYVVCNASEGEPGVKKDGYIIEHFADRVIEGMTIAIETIKAEKGIFYLNPVYHKKYKRLLTQYIAQSGAAVELFMKPHEAGYIGGEETSLLNAIEGRRIEPRMRPPYPPQAGLWGSPTLINNVETFYNVSLVNADEYKGERFYTITGDCLYENVYQLPADWSIEKILKTTHNYPNFPFFVQIGGDGSGTVLNSKQLDQPAGGAGSIRVYSLTKYKPRELMLHWATFFSLESCGQCTPCRDGNLRLKEILSEEEPDWRTAAELLDNLSDTSFCGLGCAAAVAIKSYVKNVLSAMPDNEIVLAKGEKQEICSCFAI